MSEKQQSTRPPFKVACPTCGKNIAWSTANPWRPFCSERCRMIDLGEWLDEGMRIAGDDAFPEDPEDVE